MNNHKHFLLYVFFMVAGIAFLIRLTLIYIQTLPAPQTFTCTFLADDLCKEYSKDPFTIVTNAWGSLQITWTFMLIFVHLTQIARAVTTYETMRGHTQVGPILTAVATGTTSPEGAQVTDDTNKAKKKEGCFTQWSRLLGLDTFMTIAFQGYKGSQQKAKQPKAPGNPFTRGVVRNCQDFWMDGPVFGRRLETGKALLGGERVDYTALYEVPRGGSMRYRAGGYEAVPGGEGDV